MRTYMNLFEIARLVSPIIQSWIDDYGGYQRSSPFRVLNKIYLALVKWVKWKYKKKTCLLYTSPSPRDRTRSRMPSSA